MRSCIYTDLWSVKWMSATSDLCIHKQSSSSSTSSTPSKSASIIKSAMKGSAEAEIHSLVDEGCRIVVSASGFSYWIAVSYFQKAKGFLFCIGKIDLYKVVWENMKFVYNKVTKEERTGALWPCWRGRCSSRFPPDLVRPPYPVS